MHCNWLLSRLQITCLLLNPKLRCHLTWLNQHEKLITSFSAQPPFFLVSWISRFSAPMTLPQWGTLASMGTLFQTFRWILSHHQNGECRKTSVLRLLFQHFTLMISSSLLALNTTSCCQLPNLHHMLRPVYWTSGLKQSTQHFTCMSHNSKHSKFITNFRSSPAKLFLHMSVNGNSILAVVEAQTLSHFWVLYFSHIPPMIF